MKQKRQQQRQQQFAELGPASHAKCVDGSVWCPSCAIRVTNELVPRSLTLLRPALLHLRLGSTSFVSSSLGFIIIIGVGGGTLDGLSSSLSFFLYFFFFYLRTAPIPAAELALRNTLALGM